MDASKMATVLRLIGIGWYVGLCIGGGGYGGLMLDRQFDTGPLLTLFGLAVGIVIAIAGMLRMLMAVLSDNSEPVNTDGAPKK